LSSKEKNRVEANQPLKLSNKGSNLKKTKEQICIIFLLMLFLSSCNENQLVSLQKDEEQIKEKKTDVPIFKKEEIKDKKTAELEEEKRKLMRNMEEMAVAYAQVYRRHDKQYYLERMKEIFAKCSGGKDFDSSCFNSRMELLKSE
jgi:hypothetical protein